MLGDLPSLCAHLVAERLADGLRCGERVHLLSVSRGVHSLFAAPLYEAVDRGCVAALGSLLAGFLGGLREVERAAEEADEEERGRSDGGGAGWGGSALKLLRATCAAAALPVSGTKDALRARLAERALEGRLRRREMRAAAAELLGTLSAQTPSALRCAVRPRVRAAIHSGRCTGMVTDAEARAMGADEASLDSLPHDVHRLFSSRAAPTRLYLESSVCAHLLERRGPGSLQDDPATALPDPAAQLDELAGRRLRAALEGSRRAEAAAMLAEAGLDWADVARSRVGASALERFAAGGVGAAAVRRLAKAVRRALAAQAGRSAQLDAEIAALGIGGPGVRDLLERELPGELAPMLDCFVLFGTHDVATVRAQLSLAAERGMRRAHDAALADSS